MKPAGYGESQPRLDDDRRPIVLLVLDGLGDRPVPELGDRTPAEAADTPHLDALAARGANGWHVPFGWGPAPSSEVSHWSMFGFHDVAFPGRAVLEGLGAGLDVPEGRAVLHAALRTSRLESGRLWITGRASAADSDDARLLFSELHSVLADDGFTLAPLGGGESLLVAEHHEYADVTDTDPFFETFHPLLRPRPTTENGTALATDLERALRGARAHLLQSTVNARRVDAGLPALDTLSTKWAGVRRPIPSFLEQTGIAGAAVTSTRFYRGLAKLLDMQQTHLRPESDLAHDIAARVAAAGELIEAGAQFVHVHTKATDEAGHTKDPYAKRDVLQQIDQGLAGLDALSERAVIAVTGDHATPSVHGVLHTGDPTPLTIVGPGARRDEVTAFGEWTARHGWFGKVSAAELLPLLLSCANRPVFLGHRITPRWVPALADEPEHFRVTE
ncbi:phosphoglycerate mutase [Epidermidibacterium keratini]|uniref:Phosphoglycerate mutase n=1 Tax=Epidermidibacterium keratini TaxID=1891644 RepID=A0A7L4YP31_9ACTN|nr:alkaline phosphatase family protein [Epidermidibacterium keratini]QHC00634.1 phosphoglycerate mutase [Epidermidibacterium keratini]